MKPFLTHHPTARPAAILTVLLLVAAPWGIRWLTLDNGIDQWVADDNAAAQYADFQRDFGGEDFLLLAYGGHPLFEEDALDLQRRVLDAIEALPDVSAVQSIPALFRDQFGSESPEELESEIDSSPFYDRIIVAPDRTMGGMIVSSRTRFSAGERRAYVEALHQAAAPFRDAGWHVYFAGPAVLNAALDTASEAESRRLLPVAVVASCFLLWLLLRSLRKVAAVAIVSALTLAITLGLMGWFGLTMNMVTVALPPVLWVLSTAYAVHLLRYYDTALGEGRPPAEALNQAVAWGLRPCFLAALTTALGFLALLTTGMKPVRELGLAAALGIPVAFVVTFGLTPLLIRLFRLSARPIMERGTGAPPVLSERYAKPILAAAALAAVACAILAARVRIESNPLTFLDPESAIVRDSNAVAQRFTGLYTLETVLQLPGSWLAPAAWPAIEAQGAALETAAGIARVISPLDYLKKLNQWSNGGGSEAYRLPESAAEAQRLVDEVPEAARGPLDALVSPDGRQVRLSALVRVMDGAELLEIVRTSEDALAGAPDGVTGYHTGVVLRLVRAQFALITTQLKSLGFAILAIFACIAAGLRSTRLLMLSVAPNLLPVLALFGIMGLLRIPLDPATVTVAAMALGIAVDDTLHLLVTWRERSRDTGDARQALRDALRLNGPAMAATTLTACAGFLTLGLSSFTPIRYFGLLSAAAMAVALAADLWVLPALILALGPRRMETP